MYINSVAFIKTTAFCPFVFKSLPHTLILFIKRLDACELTEASMEAFSAALCSGQSQLKEVDMKRNIMDDSGVEALCKALRHPLCALQSLK